MNCAVYARISTRDKGQDTENQLAQIRTWCAQNGHVITQEYSDCVSGSGKVKRPGFEQMMADARSGAFKMLLFWSLDRLSREGVWKTLGYLRDLDEALVCWRSHSEPYLDSCGVFKEAILAILAAIAKQERMRISERVKAGLEVARANGKRPGRRKHEENVELNNQIIELFRNGRSIREIALLLEISPTPVQRILKPLQPEKPKKVKPAPSPYVPTTTGLGLIKEELL